MDRLEVERPTSLWLSVIMPTFNGAAFLREALESIVAQRDEEIEVIAIDDGSTDETVAILRAYQRVLPLSIVEQLHGGNWAASTARGMAQARGEWLCWLHQDDAWRPGRLNVVKKHAGGPSECRDAGPSLPLHRRARKGRRRLAMPAAAAWPRSDAS